LIQTKEKYIPKNHSYAKLETWNKNIMKGSFLPMGSSVGICIGNQILERLDLNAQAMSSTARQSPLSGKFKIFMANLPSDNSQSIFKPLPKGSLSSTGILNSLPIMSKPTDVLIEGQSYANLTPLQRPPEPPNPKLPTKPSSRQKPDSPQKPIKKFPLNLKSLKSQKPKNYYQKYELSSMSYRQKHAKAKSCLENWNSAINTYKKTIEDGL
jgi:hypothetical protein